MMEKHHKSVPTLMYCKRQNLFFPGPRAGVVTGRIDWTELWFISENRYHISNIGRPTRGGVKISPEIIFRPPDGECLDGECPGCEIYLPMGEFPDLHFAWVNEEERRKRISVETRRREEAKKKQREKERYQIEKSDAWSDFFQELPPFPAMTKLFCLRSQGAFQMRSPLPSIFFPIKWKNPNFLGVEKGIPKDTPIDELLSWIQSQEAELVEFGPFIKWLFSSGKVIVPDGDYLTCLRLGYRSLMGGNSIEGFILISIKNGIPNDFVYAKKSDSWFKENLGGMPKKIPGCLPKNVWFVVEDTYTDED